MTYNLQVDSALQMRIRALMRLLRPRRAIGVRKKRYGNIYDGGYVMLESLESAEVAYSIGINNDVSWDIVMAGFGTDIYMYDHTISHLPEENERFHFQPLGVASSDDESPDLRKLETLVHANNHGGHFNMILKMDIEGYEWSCFDTIDRDILNRFGQIVCEFHGMSAASDEAWLARSERALSKVCSTHQVVHVHGNNNSSPVTVAGVTMPDTFELTLAHRALYDFEDTSELFPGPLDNPCTAGKADIFLGRFEY